MLILYDRRIPAEAKEKLAATGRTLPVKATLLEIESEGLVDPTVSGHPVVFFCPVPGKLIVAPDLPERYIRNLKKESVNFSFGNFCAGKNRGMERWRNGDRIPVHYNAVATGDYLIHELSQTDPVILQNCHYLKKIPVKQAFTRSHLLHLRGNHFLTSDKGIEKALQERGLDALYVSPGSIVLPGHANGGIGGCCGICGDRVFFNGALRFHPEGEVIRNLLNRLGFRIVELTEGPLTDTGSFLFLST
jgi:hypothetical protein